MAMFRVSGLPAALLIAGVWSCPAHAQYVELDSCYKNGTFEQERLTSGQFALACHYTYQPAGQYPPEHGAGSVSMSAGALLASTDGYHMAASGSDILHVQGSWSGSVPVKLTLKLKASIAGALSQAETEEAILGLMEAGTSQDYQFDNVGEFDADIKSGDIHQIYAGQYNSGSAKVSLEGPPSTTSNVTITTTTLVTEAAPTIYLQWEIVTWEAISPGSGGSETETSTARANVQITLPPGLTYTSNSGQFLGH